MPLKNLNIFFPKIKMIKKDRLRYSTSLAIRKMQIKTTIPSLFRQVIDNSRQTVTRVGENVEKSYFTAGNVNW